jgi:hypothetical protein
MLETLGTLLSGIAQTWLEILRRPSGCVFTSTAAVAGAAGAWAMD